MKRSFAKRNKFYGHRFFFLNEFSENEILVHYSVVSKFRRQNNKLVLRDKNNIFSAIKTKRCYFG